MPKRGRQEIESAGDEKKVIITLRMPAALADRLREEARRTGVSVNALILMKLKSVYDKS